MSLYYKVKAEIDEIAKNCEITDREEIRKMFEERLEAAIKDMLQPVIETLSMTGLDDVIKRAMLRTINTTHRYTQGEFWTMMMKIMDAYGEQEERYFDARNEWCKNACKRMGIAGRYPELDDKLFDHQKSHKF